MFLSVNRIVVGINTSPVEEVPKETACMGQYVYACALRGVVCMQCHANVPYNEAP